MITRATYFNWTASNTLPVDKDIRDGDELIRQLTKGGKNWSAVDGSDTYRELVANHLKLLNSLVQPAQPKKEAQSAASKARSAKTARKGRGVARVKKTAKADGKSFADRMKAARDAKRATANDSSDDQPAAPAKPSRKPNQSSAKAGKAKPAPAAKAPTKAQQADAQYESAQKSGSLSEEVRQIRRFIGLVKKSTKDAIVNAAVALNKAIFQRKITKTSPYATDIEFIQNLYYGATKSPYKLVLSDARLAELVAIAGGQRVYKSVELLSRFLGWAEKERTHEQVKAFLKQLIAAAPKIKAGDPYAEQIKAVIRLLSGVKAKTTFHLTKTPLSGLSGLMGVLIEPPRAVAGLSGVEPVASTSTPVSRPVASAGPAMSSVTVPVPAAAPVVVASPVGPLVVKKRFPDVMSAHQVAAINYPTYLFKDDTKTNKWGTLIGRPSIPFKMMISGEPGAGKSTLMFQLAVYLARNFGPTRYVSSEEYPSLTLADKLERAGGAVKDLSFSADLSSISRELKFIIIDSANHVKLSLAEFLALTHRYPGTSFILILQNTKEGRFKGGNEWPHEVDCVFRVVNEPKPGTVLTVKNRFVKEPGTINVFETE